MKYNLYKDSLMKLWVRDYYEIEAESLKEAIDQINDGSADYVDSEVLWDDFQDIVDISENGNNPTEIIYDEDDKLIWENNQY